MRADLTRNLVICASCAPAALVCWFVFRAVSTNLAITTEAVGEVDAGTKMGIAFGYIAMVCGTAFFGVVAIVTGVRALRLWLRIRKEE